MFIETNQAWTKNFGNAPFGVLSYMTVLGELCLDEDVELEKKSGSHSSSAVDHLLKLTKLPSFDIDLPLEVDDEYWETEDPSVAFQQPPGLPSKVGAFILFIKLSQIVAFALKTVVGVRPFLVVGLL